MGNEASSVVQNLQTNLTDKIEKAHQKYEQTVNGNPSSSEIEPSTPQTNQISVEDIPMIDSEQIELIRSTWNVLEHRKHEVGSLAFLNLFTAHPHTKDHFGSFKKYQDLAELAESEIFRNHASRVMGVLHRVILYFIENKRRGRRRKTATLKKINKIIFMYYMNNLLNEYMIFFYLYKLKNID